MKEIFTKVFLRKASITGIIVSSSGIKMERSGNTRANLEITASTDWAC